MGFSGKSGYYFSICRNCVDKIDKNRLESSFGYAIDLQYYIIYMMCCLCQSDFTCGIGITKPQLEKINRELKVDLITDL